MEATSTMAAARTRSAALDLPAIATFALGAVLVGWVGGCRRRWVVARDWAWTALVTLGASVVVLLAWFG